MFNFKGKRNRPLVPTMVIDDFFETPELWRSFALQQEYFKGDRGTWPGIRTKMLHELNQELYNVLENKLLSYYPMFKGFSKIESTFQVISEEWGEGWIHDDNPEHNLAGIVFLTPNPPKGSGNSSYAEQDDIDGERIRDMFVADMDPDIDHSQFQKYRIEHRNQFTPTTIVENKFNRCKVFDPRTWHSANNFFGKTLEDSRLTLVFFCNGYN